MAPPSDPPPPGPAPADELDRRRMLLRSAAEDRLWDLLWWWLVAHGLFLGALCLGACAGPGRAGLIVVVGLFWLASVAVAAAIGLMTFSRWSSLSRGWIAAGLVPWAVLVIEATALAVAWLT